MRYLTNAKISTLDSLSLILPYYTGYEVYLTLPYVMHNQPEYQHITGTNPYAFEAIVNGSLNVNMMTLGYFIKHP